MVFEISFSQLIVVILGIVGYIFYLFFKKTRWREVYTATGNNIPKAQNIYNRLKNSGVKCKLKTNSPLANRWGGSGPVMSHRVGSVTVFVKKEDEHKAFKLLREI